MRWPVITGAPFPKLPDAPTSLAELLHLRRRQYPQSRVIEIDQAGIRVENTNEKLYQIALRILQACTSSFAEEGDVVLCFESPLDFIPAAWACVQANREWLPWHLLKARQNEFLVSRLSWLSENLRNPLLLTTTKIRSQLPSHHARTFRSVQTIDTATVSAEPIPEWSEGDGSLLMPTSGTTGLPRIASLQYQSLLNRFLLWEAKTSGIRLLHSPFDSVGGLGVILPNAFGTIFMQPERVAASPADHLRAIEEFGIRSVGLTSSIASRLLDVKEKFDLSSVESIGFGAEPIISTIVSQFGARLNALGAKPRISFSYGMTETGLICRKSNIALEQIEERYVAHGHPVSVGSCTFGYRLRIVDDAGEVQAPGVVGNIEVGSAEKLFAGYLDRGQITRCEFAHDGWFKTGDLGRIDEGELTVVGREKSTIIVNAKKHSLETIEAALRQISSVRFVVAGAVREPTAASDELAIFFVPNPEVTIDVAGVEIRRRVGQHGIAVKHLVPLRPDEVPRTATGKVMRDQLLQLYRDGGLQVHDPVGVSDVAHSFGVVKSRLVDIWQTALKLGRSPADDENFFELGGDSLASAEIIAAVEEEFRCELPIERFFERPTITNMRKLIENRGRPISHAHSDVSGEEILHKLQRYSGSWNGERLFDGSFVVGFNVGGARQPIFWICQEYREALQFSKHLGKDQPLYALRSCVGVVPVKSYDDVLDTVCNRYLWEILAVTGRPLVLGGDCQAGIIALELARRLARIGRPLELLVLQEWTYKRGVYEHPTVLIYGEDSYTAELYQQQKQASPDWSSLFPKSAITHVPGKHGELSWRDESVTARVKILRREMDARGMREGAFDTATKIAALQTRLAIREAELNTLKTNLSAALKNLGKEAAGNSDYNLLSGPDGVDRLWYWKTYPDVARAAIDPVKHYLEFGWREGRDPRVDFSTNAYLEANESVRRAGHNPLVHYLRKSRAKGCKFKFKF